MRNFFKALKPLSGVVSKSFSNASSKTLPSFNLVIRDHNQGAFRNGQDPADAKSLEIMGLFDELNQHGPECFDKVEGGGQEPGSVAMSFRSPKDLFQKSVAAMPNGTKIRSLTRGAYGNSVVALHPDDLEKGLEFTDTNTENRTAYKIFDYNINLDEMRHCVETAKKLGAKIEIAIPHSPESSYQEFFVKKVEEAAKFAAENGADLSVKRMVAGLTVEEAKTIAHTLFPAALKYGIVNVGLHAHGDVPASAAEFIKIGMDYGIKVNTDFVHDGSGPTPNSPGTFPSMKGIVKELAARGVDIELTLKQLENLAKIDKLQQERDKEYVALRVGGAWSEEKKIAMGLPDGGESYSVEAIVKSQYSKELKKHFVGAKDEDIFNIAKDIFEVSYKEFRERFGMPTGVTPGHKRIETGAIHSADKIIGLITQECVEGNVINQDKLSKLMKSKSYDDLYSGLNSDIVDAFRNDKLPQKLEESALRFLCSENMKNTLKQDSFKGLDQETKNSLIEKAYDREKVMEEIRVRGLENKGLPKEITAGSDDKFSNVSLLQASGKREYLESDKAPERYKASYVKISANVEKGAEVSDINAAAIFAATLTAGETTFVDGTFSRKNEQGEELGLPSAKGLSVKEHQEECKKFYTENRANFSANLAKRDAYRRAAFAEHMKNNPTDSENDIFAQGVAAGIYPANEAFDFHPKEEGKSPNPSVTLVDRSNLSGKEVSKGSEVSV